VAGATIETTLEPVPSGELAAFVAAVETGSLQAAGEALSLTQSAVTKRVQKLEARLGTVLLDRGRLGVRPTVLGQSVYPPAKEALRQLELVVQTAAAGRRRSQADLRLSASLTTGEFLVPGWLSAFRAERPDVHPQLEVVNSTAALAAVRDGRSAIGFIESRDATEDVETLVVARDDLVVVVAPAHRWARRRSLAARELASEPFMTRERDSGTRAVLTVALAQAGIELVPELEVASIQSLKRSIAAGGFTVLSRLAIAEEQRAGRLVGIPIRDLDLTRDLRAVRDASRRPAAVAAQFWTWLSHRISDPKV
jgi:DNA-binding transcriptional LysR family regulator